jgi:DNA-directed RNA polymerase specialized sigma24 family protein
MPAASLVGDEGRLFQAHHEQLTRLVASSVNASAHIVEDACAFAWLQLLCHQPDRQRTLKWLLLVATREVWRLTAQEWRMAVELDTSLVSDTSESLADSRINWVQSADAVGTLAPDERRLLLLSAAGYSYQEISSATGHTERAVERRLKRARDHARQAVRRGQRRTRALHV